METKFQEEIDHLQCIVENKHKVFLKEKEKIHRVIDDIQKDITQGRSDTPRIELIKQQDLHQLEIKELFKEFVTDRDLLVSKITRLEESKSKYEEDIRLGKESVEYNLENIQKYLERGNANEVFLAIDSIKNALVIINNKLGE